MELAALLDQAQAAPPDRRIEWRDPIAAHGPRAIEGVRPWLTDGALAAFAVRVIERAGSNGEREMASRVLRSARVVVPADVAGDVAWALHRLGARSRPAAATEPAPVASQAVPVRREPPRLTVVTRRRGR